MNDQNNAVPKHIQDLLAHKQADHRFSVGGDSFPYLKESQGILSIIHNGATEYEAPGRHLDMIIMDAMPDKQRFFYTGAYDPKSEETQPVTCYSHNGITPHPSIEMKQSELCATCPMNIAGSGQNGTKACSTKKLLVGHLLEGFMKPFSIRLNASSLYTRDNLKPGENCFSAYSSQYGNMLPYVTTRVTLGPSTNSGALMRFSNMGYLSPEWVAYLQGHTVADSVKAILPTEVPCAYVRIGGATTPQNNPAAITHNPAVAPVQTTPVVDAAPVAPVQTAPVVDVAPVAPVQTTPVVDAAPVQTTPVVDAAPVAPVADAAATGYNAFAEELEGLDLPNL